ncbi:hypothetical protein NIES3787_41210 [Microcystis aeruginosa NIES-3787]|uniref:Uncharacterized protein n=1 Tax=Microcystis aeruginosa NIES-3787 TaxID=2517782 RepID=A0A6H9GRM7_MICAE|nr:hypothetical protein NIES3787_41210 [Microcystis aeruginosa NIES-3787]
MALRFKLIKVEKADPAITVLTEKSILADSDGAAVHFVQIETISKSKGNSQTTPLFAGKEV